MPDFNDLVKLNDISIYEHLKYVGAENLVVMFHTTNCQPCFRQKGRFIKLASRALEHYHFATMFKWDAPETTEALGIKLYPSVCLFRDKRAVSVRQGSISLTEMEKWLLFT